MMQPPTDVSDILAEALAYCRQTLAGVEQQIMDACSVSTLWEPVLLEAVAAHSEALGRLPGLPGRNAPAELAYGADARLSDAVIQLLPCDNNPTAPPGCDAQASCPPPLNAFALNRVAFTLDPLLMAFAEGAAWWGALALEAGGDPDAVDRQQLVAGLGEIFFANSEYRPFTVVTSEDAAALLRDDPFTAEIAVSAMYFLIFHELGHANLNHSLINHTVRYGVARALDDAGAEPTPAQLAEVEAELLRIKVSTETQADIYAASLLSAIGGSSYGPRLFTGGMAAFVVRAGVCDPDLAPDELYACIVQDSPNASHPPLDVRTELIRRIMDGGEDLTGMLTAGALFE